MRVVVALALVLGAVVATGCIERKLLILTDPPNVQVFLDGRDLGTTKAVSRADLAKRFDLKLLDGDALLVAPAQPADAKDWIASAGPELGFIAIPFDHYAAFEIVLVSEEGLASQRHVVRPDVPAYEHFPLDLFADVLLPFTFSSTHVYRFTLEPSQPPNFDDVYDRAIDLREQAQSMLRERAAAQAEGDDD